MSRPKCTVTETARPKIRVPKLLKNPAQETLKRCTRLEIMGVTQPKIWLRFPVASATSRLNYFWLHDVHF